MVIDVLANDSDADGDTLTIKSLTKPAHGTAVIEDGKVKYTPAKGYSGKDNFEYTVSDGKGGESKAAVTVTVNKKIDENKNHAPTPKDDFVKTDFETKVIIDALANDSDADGDKLTLDSLSQPKYGKAEIKSGKIEYMPAKDFSGKDSFSYMIKDAKGVAATATIEVEVAPKPNTPPSAKDDSATTDYEEAVVIDVLANDSDADGDALTIKSVTKPTHGSALIENGKIQYFPAKGYTGKDSFEYTMSDGKGGASKATVTVTVKEKPNRPPEAKNDGATTDYGKSIIVDLIKNDSDADSDSLKIKSLTKPKHGTAVVVNGKVKYTPANGFSGKDNFEYTVSDGRGGESKAVVSITVKEKPNTPPEAKNDSVTTEFETKITIDVLKNDSDADGDALTIKSVTKPKHGTVEISKGSKIEYQPQKGYSGSDSFEYTVSDSRGGESSAKITVMVKAQEDATNKKEFHFPIIGDGDVESVIKLFTNFTKVVKDEYTEFQLEKSKGDIKVYKSGELEIESNKAPLPQGKLAPGSKLEVHQDKLSVEFKLTKNLSFK